MTLFLTANKDVLHKLTGKRYRQEYDNLRLQTKVDIIKNIEILIEIEKKLTLLDEIEIIEKNKKEDFIYEDFLEVLRLKRILRRVY
jgi:hypothetical protein